LKGDFIPYLSIIDVLMFNSKEDIKNMLEKYKKSNKGGVSERH